MSAVRPERAPRDTPPSADSSPAHAGTSTRPAILGTLEVIGAAACFSAIPIFTVLATERGGASLESVLAGRYVLAAIALLAIAGSAVRRPVAAGEIWRMILLGGTGQAAIAYLALSALRYLPAATMVFLFYTFPAWVALLAAARRTERLTPRRLLALALALSGIWALVGSPWAGTLHPLGIILTLAAAVVYALYIPLIGSLQRNVGPIVTSMWVSVGAAAVFVLLGVGTGRLSMIEAPVAWFGVAGLALISTAAAFILFLRGLAQLGAVRTAIASTAEPFFVAILGALVLNQSTSRATLLGGTLVASAVLLIATASERPREE